MEETEETAQVKSRLMKVVSRMTLTVLFCTLCVPNSQVILGGIYQSGYIGR